MVATRSLVDIDFSKIPEDLVGTWIVVRVGEDQEILAKADNPREAMEKSKADPMDLGVVLTQVPEVPSAARMGKPGGPKGTQR